MVSNQSNISSNNFDGFYRSVQKEINQSQKTKHRDIHLNELHRLITSNKAWINKVENSKDIATRRNQLFSLYNKISNMFKLDHDGMSLANEIKAIAEATSLFTPDKQLENKATASTTQTPPIDQTVTFISNEAPKPISDLPTLESPSTPLPVNEKRLTLSMKKPSDLWASYFPSGKVPFPAEGPRSIYDCNEPMGEQVFWLYPFWEGLTVRGYHSTAYSFRITETELTEEMSKITVLNDVGNNELESYLKCYPQTQYLVVKSSKLTQFPTLKLDLKMLCVNGCSNLVQLPINCPNLKTLHCQRTAVTKIPESYAKLEVLDCSYTNAYIPNLPSLKVINAISCKNLKLSHLKYAEAIVCDKSQQKLANTEGAHLVPYDKSIFYAPKALQHVMYLYGNENLFINYHHQNSLIIPVKQPGSN